MDFINSIIEFLQPFMNILRANDVYWFDVLFIGVGLLILCTLIRALLRIGMCIFKNSFRAALAERQLLFFDLIGVCFIALGVLMCI